MKLMKFKLNFDALLASVVGRGFVILKLAYQNKYCRNVHIILNLFIFFCKETFYYNVGVNIFF